MEYAPRKSSSIAAAASIAVVLWMAAPARAAESDPSPGRQSAGAATTRVASVHRWPRYHLALWYRSRLRYVESVPSSWQSFWSPQPALLMLGIAY
jgi:hypothetical protein